MILATFGFIVALLFLVRSLEARRQEAGLLLSLLSLMSFWCSLLLLPVSFPGPALRLAAGCVFGVCALFLITKMIREGMENLRTFPYFKLSAKKLPQEFEEILRALDQLASRKTGALIVLERRQALDKYLDAGMRFDAQVKSEIMIPLFATSSPVHDGALVVSRGRVKAVRVVLPLSQSASVPKGVGTRHRSAIGISEVSDSITLVASEERGTLSLSYRGKLATAKSLEELRHFLARALEGKPLP